MSSVLRPRAKRASRPHSPPAPSAVTLATITYGRSIVYLSGLRRDFSSLASHLRPTTRRRSRELLRGRAALAQATCGTCRCRPGVLRALPVQNKRHLGFANKNIDCI